MLFRVFYILIYSFFLSSCLSEYREHYIREHTPLETRVSSGTFIPRESFAILPDKKALPDLISSIDRAEKRIWIEIYTWTEKSTLDAVIRAHHRWVDVRVILEWSVYGTPWINNDTQKILKSENIPVVFADNTRYTFTHAKIWLIDDIWCLSTGNWSYSTFTKNREFIACNDDPSLRANIEEIFLADSAYELPYFSGGLDNRLGVSPLNMRAWLTENISLAKKSLYIYNQSLSDTGIIDLLESLRQSWVDVKVCTNSIPWTWALLDATFSIKNLKKPYLHAKLVMIDEEKILLWSINFTENAIDRNREIALLVKKNEIFYSQVKKLFFTECFPD